MRTILFFLLLIFISTILTNLNAQRVGFINTQTIRDKYPDNKLAEQRCQTMIDEWKRELKSMTDKEEALQFDIKKNRLIWSDAEKATKEKELATLQTARTQYVKDKFSPNGESDKMVRNVMLPIEEKIFAAVQDVAEKEKLDFIWDQSTQPLSYVNFKYDVTLKVLKLLGVDVSLEEKEQEQKIATDPRNDEDRQRESQSPRRRRRGDPSPTTQPTNPATSTPPIERQLTPPTNQP